MNINDAYLWLKSIEGVTNNNINQIESNNIDIKDLINFSDKEIYNLKNINTNIKENIVKYKSLTYLEEIKSNLEKKFIKYVSIYDESYPSNLKHIYDAPKILFYKGNLDVLKNKIKNLKLCFPLTKINNNWVVEFVDSEGNHIELTAPIK